MISRCTRMLVFYAAVAAAGCEPLPSVNDSSSPANAPRSKSNAPSQPTDLQPMLPPLEKQDLQEGTGPAAKKGDTVIVHYTGTLTDGSRFDSSVDRGTPFEFTLGAGNVIAGWDLGVVGMKKGGKRRLTIPPHLGYGDSGSPPKIPGGATLLFDIELLEIVPSPPAPSGPDGESGTQPPM